MIIHLAGPAKINAIVFSLPLSFDSRDNNHPDLNIDNGRYELIFAIPITPEFG